MNRKSWALMFVLVIGLAGIAYGAARAQQSSTARPVANAPSCPCMQGGTMAKGMMGGQMMRERMMGMNGGRVQIRTRTMGMGPMIPANASIAVKDIENGVTVTVTSTDAKTARRIQLMADMMRDMHELRSLR